jgi:hypothetical protein
MIFASIVSACRSGVQAWWTNPDQVFKVIMPFLALGVIAAIVFVPGGPAADTGPVREASDRPPDCPAAGRPTCRCA